MERSATPEQGLISRVLEARIEELESQLAFQEQLYQQLDKVVTRQDRELMEIKGLLSELAQKLADLRHAASGASGPAEEVPPHY